MSKQQRNNDKLALLIGSCWFTLFAFWVFVLISGRYLEVACTNEQVIKVCNFIDNNKILLCVVKFAFYYFQSILVFYAILKKKIFSSNIIPISIYVLVIWLVKHFTSQYSFSNYLDFLSIIFIIILDKKKWLRAITGNILLFLFTLISLMVKNMSNINVSNLPLIIQVLLMIDILIMNWLYYSYSRKEVDHNERHWLVLQIKQKVENCKCNLRNTFSNRNSSDNSICNESDIKENRFYRIYCTTIFIIITYGSILLVSLLFNRPIEATISVIFFHIFRKKDEKTFHASNDMMCWLISVTSFSIVSALALDLKQSILCCICLSYILTIIMYYIKDYFDLVIIRNKLEKTTLKELELNDLIGICKENMCIEDIRLVYDYLHKKRDTSTDKFIMNRYISRRTLFRMLKKVKDNYETRLMP